MSCLTPQRLAASALLSLALLAPAGLSWADQDGPGTLEGDKQKSGQKFERTAEKGVVTSPPLLVFPKTLPKPPVPEPEAAPSFPNWGEVDDAVKPVLVAMRELLSTPAANKELGHILKEAEAMLSKNPKSIQFSEVKEAYAIYDYDDDQIILNSDSLKHINPHLAAVVLAHELQHRYDFRIQREQFNDDLYTLETEKRAFKVGAIALGLTMDKMDAGSIRLKQHDLSYFREEAENRIAYLQGETSPYFNQLVEQYYRKENAQGGHSSGRETSKLSILATQERLANLNTMLADLEIEERLFAEKVNSGEVRLANRLKSVREQIKVYRVERELMERRLKMAQFEANRGMKLTVDTKRAVMTDPPMGRD